MSNTIHIAAAQIDVQLGKVEHNLARILAYSGEAAENGADLVVFPECALTGYSFDSRAEALPSAQTVPCAKGSLRCSTQLPRDSQIP